MAFARFDRRLLSDTPVSSYIIDSLGSTPVRTRYINDGKDINDKDNITHFTELFRCVFTLQSPKSKVRETCAKVRWHTLIHSHC